MFPITITLHDKSQLNAVLNALALTVAGAAPTPPANQGNAAQTEKAAATPSTAPASAAQETKAETSDAAPEYTIDLAKKLTTDLVKLKGRDAAVAVLTEFKVPVAAKLPADQIAPFCKAAQKVLAS